MIVVVDASVAAKWYLPEDHAAEAELLLDSVFEMHAPDLLLAEFGNIHWKKLMRGEVGQELAEAAVTLIQDQDIVLHPQEELLEGAFAGAIETHTSIYDWFYLALSIALDCPLVTADRKFYLSMRRTNFRKYPVWVEHVPQLLTQG